MPQETALTRRNRLLKEMRHWEGKSDLFGEVLISEVRWHVWKAVMLGSTDITEEELDTMEGNALETIQGMARRADERKRSGSDGEGLGGIM